MRRRVNSCRERSWLHLQRTSSQARSSQDKVARRVSRRICFPWWVSRLFRSQGISWMSANVQESGNGCLWKYPDFSDNPAIHHAWESEWRTSDKQAHYQNKWKEGLLEPSSIIHCIGWQANASFRSTAPGEAALHARPRPGFHPNGRWIRSNHDDNEGQSRGRGSFASWPPVQHYSL